MYRLKTSTDKCLSSDGLSRLKAFSGQLNYYFLSDSGFTHTLESLLLEQEQVTE
jgi:hypothetical protein